MTTVEGVSRLAAETLPRAPTAFQLSRPSDMRCNWIIAGRGRRDMMRDSSPMLGRMIGYSRLMGSRFDNWSRGPAILVLALLAGLIGLGLACGSAGVQAQSNDQEEHSDSALYSAVIDRVQRGESYYSAAAGEQRERGYPLRPVMTVRLPTLAYVAAAFGGAAQATVGLVALGAVTAALMIFRLKRISSGRIVWWSAMTLTFISSAALFRPSLVVLHEVWSALFIMLAMVVRSRKYPCLSVLCGLFAVAIRETAIPVVLIMALFAWQEGKSREFRAWIVAMGIFVLGYAAHYAMVISNTTATGVESKGWLEFGGWPFVLGMVRFSSILAGLPPWLTALIVPLAIVGWASRRGEIPARVTVLLITFVGAFSIIGRPENWYWGLLYVAFIGAGLAFSPSAARSLVRQAVRGRRLVESG